MRKYAATNWLGIRKCSVFFGVRESCSRFHRGIQGGTCDHWQTSRPHENGIPCYTVKRRQDRRTPKRCCFHGVLSLHRLSILTVRRHFVSVSAPSRPYVRLHS